MLNFFVQAKSVHCVREIFMSEIFILHLDNADEDLYTKILKVINESGHSLQRISAGSGMPLQFKDLKILPDRHQVFQSGREVALTGKEFEILMLLAENIGRVFSKEQIYNIVWQEFYDGDYNIVMSHIHNIREKIEDNPSKPIYIQTVWGVGYRFNKNLSSGL